MLLQQAFCIRFFVNHSWRLTARNIGKYIMYLFLDPKLQLLFWL